MANPIPTLILNTDVQTTELLELYLKESEDINISGTFSDIDQGYEAVLNVNPSIVIVDISKKPDAALGVINKISAKNKKCKIIVIASTYSTSTIIKVMRAGAKDFLPKPVIKENLLNSLSKIKEQIKGIEPENKKCRVITAFSNKGGIGKTTIATNLALELAKMTKEKVALVDLNLQLGDITTFLDIKPSFDVSYVIKNLSKTDDTFLLNSLERYKDTSMYVLADPPYLEQSENITAEEIDILLDTLKQTFSYIVLDTSANFDVKTIAALDNSDLILFITTVNLPAIRNCQRCLDLFERLGYEKDKTKIVINRYMENDEIKIEDVEDALNQKVYCKIPNNYFTIMSAINKGVPVSEINADANVVESYRELAAIVSDNIYKQSFSKKFERTPVFNLMNLFKE